MSEPLLLTLIGAALLAVSIRVLHSEANPTIRSWSIGWVAFISAGLLGRVTDGGSDPDLHLPIFLAYVMSGAAPVLFMIGVCRLTQWRLPTWVVPMSGLIITARGVIGVSGDTVMAELWSIPIETGNHLGAAYLIWRWSRHQGRPHDQVALVGAHLIMGTAAAAMATTRINGGDTQPLTLLLGAATVALAGAQIAVMLRLDNDRADEAIEDRERDLALLRDLAQLGTRHSAGPALLHEAARLLADRLAIDWVGFWRWSASGGRWVASEASGVPRQVCSSVQLLALRIDDLASQPGGAAPPSLTDLNDGCDAFDEPGCALIPLEWQGEVLGVMGVGRLNTNRPLPADLRSVLATLAGELSLSLRHVLSIQQRDRANLDLLRERRKLAAVIETAPMGLLVTTADGQVELMNSAAAEHIGCEEPERFIGGPMTRFLDDLLTRIAEADDFIENVRLETDSQGVMRDVEVEVLRPEPATLLLFSSRVFDDEGRVTARIWASRDVTAERALGDQLRHAQKLETLGTLSGGIAHDFNNQLAVILGNARFARDALEHEAVSVPDVDEALSDLERAADHCAQLTRSLLSFARRAPVSLGYIGPNELVRDLGDLLRPLLPSSIELKCEAESALPSILADGAQLQQVLVNLALNARDAIAEHGVIRIRAAMRDVDVEHVRRRGVGRPGRYLYFDVSDTGHGLESDTLDRIFEPFYTTKPVGKGTGLGLAIVHGVVTAHGGWIEVDSTPDEGTEFQIYLPIEDRDAGAPIAPSDAHDAIALATVAGQRDRLLVADDDDAVRNVLVRALEARGFLVETAVDGEDAVKRFAEDTEGFSAVLLDWSMPGLQGPEAAEEILTLDPEMPVLVATGHGQIETDRDLEIIPKPFDMDDLANRLRARIDGVEH